MKGGKTKQVIERLPLSLFQHAEKIPRSNTYLNRSQTQVSLQKCIKPQIILVFICILKPKSNTFAKLYTNDDQGSFKGTPKILYFILLWVTTQKLRNSLFFTPRLSSRIIQNRPSDTSTGLQNGNQLSLYTQRNITANFFIALEKKTLHP